MKYKAGDKFIIEIVDVFEENEREFPYTTKCGNWIGDTDLDQFERYEPNKIIWRDGAIEQPQTGSKIFWVSKRNPFMEDDLGEYIHRNLTYNDYFKIEDVYWLPASEFPMPVLPELQVEACPFCGCKCRASCIENCDGDSHYIECPECSYMSAERDIKQDAINAHNELCRKLKSIP